MNYKQFKQIIEQTETVDENEYNLLVQKYGKKVIDTLFERYLNDDNIEDDDKKFNRTSYYIEEDAKSKLEFVSCSKEEYDKNSKVCGNSDRTIDLYLQEIATFPLLDATQEKELAFKIRDLRAKKEKLQITNESLDKELTIIGYKGSFNRECYSRRKQSRYIVGKLTQLQTQREQLKDMQSTYLSSNRLNAINVLIKELDEEITYLGELEDKLNIQHDYQEVFELLVNSNLRLVVSIAKKYIKSDVPIQDLIQEGNKGLMKAIEKYDVTRDNKLSTYATYWIWQSVTRAIHNQSRLIRIPVTRGEQINKILNTEKKLTIKLERKPTYKEIAEELNDTKIDETKVENILKYNDTGDSISLSEPIGDDGSLTFEEVVPDQTINVEEDGTRDILKTELDNALEEIFKTLTSREREVIKLRYGLTDGRIKTLEELGLEFSVSRETIRQIEGKALTKLRKPSIKKRIKDFL